MIEISGWKDMQQFGIERLTGEACAYSLRYLCDVNQAGLELMLAYLGLPSDTKTEAPWNSKVNQQPSVGSFMLPHHAWEELALFALYRSGYAYIFVNRDDNDELITLLGYAADEVEQALLYAAYASRRACLLLGKLKSTDVAIGDRNIHQASGRVS